MEIAAFIVAVLAFVVSCFAGWSAHRSATAAEGAVVQAKRSADAADRSADIAAQQLAMQQEEARPKVELDIEPYAKGVYRLVNLGSATAVNLRLHAEDEALIEWDEDEPRVSLEGGQGWRFMVASMADLPSQLRFVWDGHDEPEYVRMRT